MEHFIKSQLKFVLSIEKRNGEGDLAFVAFDLSHSEHQDFLWCFQNLHHFFKTSQAVRKASKTSIGPGFPGAVIFNETYFCLIHMHRDIRASMYVH